MALEHNNGSQTEKGIVCSTCHVVFDLFKRTPKMLYCGHHFCLECVRLMEKTGLIRCTTCGYKTEAPTYLEWLPTNSDALSHVPIGNDRTRAIKLDELGGWCPMGSTWYGFHQDASGSKGITSNGLPPSAESPFTVNPEETPVTNGVSNGIALDLSVSSHYFEDGKRIAGRISQRYTQSLTPSKSLQSSVSAHLSYGTNIACPVNRPRMNGDYQSPSFESQGLSTSYSYHPYLKRNESLQLTDGNIKQPDERSASTRSVTTDSSLTTKGLGESYESGMSLVPAINDNGKNRDQLRSEMQNKDQTSDLSPCQQQRSEHVGNRTTDQPPASQSLNGLELRRPENPRNISEMMNFLARELEGLMDNMNTATSNDRDDVSTSILEHAVMDILQTFLNFRREAHFRLPLNFLDNSQGTPAQCVGRQLVDNSMCLDLSITLLVDTPHDGGQRLVSVADTQDQLDPTVTDKVSSDKGVNTESDRPDCTALVPYSLFNFSVRKLASVYYLDFRTGDRRAGRVIVEIFPALAPLMSANFAILCTGKVSYKGCKVFQAWRNQSIISGDTQTNNGCGGKSALNNQFFDPDESSQGLPPVRGMIGMRRLAKFPKSQKGKVSSQFRILLATSPGITGLFGYVLSGIEVVDRISLLDDGRGNPRKKVIISDCGKLEDF